MATTELAHDTIRLERSCPHPPARVFRAYADVDQRIRWSAPSDDEFVAFESHDFRVGGIDRFSCGLVDDPDGRGTFGGTTRYEAIEEGSHIVFTERLESAAGDLLAMSLVTMSFAGDGDGCRFTVVDQVTSFAGDGPLEGSRHGYSAMLDRLDRFLST